MKIKPCWREILFNLIFDSAVAKWAMLRHGSFELRCKHGNQWNIEDVIKTAWLNRRKNYSLRNYMQ